MFQKGSLVVYGTNGVYRINDIGAPPDSSISDKTRQYYQLTPVFGSGTVYIPVDTKLFIRPVMTRDEAHRLIARIPEISEDTCSSRIQRVMTEQYRTSFESHRNEDLVRLIKTIYVKNQQLRQYGKRPCRTDEQFKHKAEELLYGELSAVLDIPYDHVESYIEKEINQLNSHAMKEREE
ncbi:CarD family transcriptional regulator [Clostridium sp. AM58-1XD]|uniref:CarD family transcriptional regulator n=1 Tax=Clostridium sp. AM58-1XD TaxID=2292307 RepID=UPI000E48E378|nr:CarD family transcriptional regulator [Clostridium sp. AM58-1XD]RGY96444.1 hypothetical protein DXA13_17010 [Clostridium sp. AM58-1XD]